MNKKALRNSVVVIVLVVLLSMVFLSLPTPSVMAANTEIIATSPTTGFVGNTIRVDGTINTTDGFFTVRWNQAINVSHGSASGVNIAASFVVPQTVGAPTGRNVSIELIDDLTGSIGTTNFTLFTKFHITVEVPPPPTQLQEGSTTSITVNVTGGEANTIYTANMTVKDPANQTHLATVSFSNTTMTGYGEASKTYPTDFDTGAHTNYTGTYHVALNKTLSERTFTVGLTNATQYVRFQVVSIRAANYTQPNEHAWVNVTFAGTTVFSKNLSALNGFVETKWFVPADASSGTYTLTVGSATMLGTSKPVSDVQQFYVTKAFSLLEVQTINLNGEVLARVDVEAYNATARVISKSTNETGWASLLLEIGNYSLKAVLTPKNVEIGAISNVSLTRNMTQILTCQLANMKILVENEQHAPMPFINFIARYNYTTRNNELQQDTKTFETNSTGTWELRNMFTKTSYVIEARRNGFLFNTTHIQSLPAQSWNNISITVPTYATLIRVVDSKNNPVSNILLAAYEWSSGTTQPMQTQRSAEGSVIFFLTFGKYRLRALDDSFMLNETTLNLIQDNLNFTLFLTVFNTDVTVRVRDYFGQPIANANVTIERKIDEEYIFAYSQFTGADGSATFASKIGGDSRISVYVGGKFVGVKTQFLSGKSSSVEFQAAENVAILGYPIPTGLFASLIFLIVIVGVVLVLARGHLMKVFGKRPKK